MMLVKQCLKVPLMLPTTPTRRRLQHLLQLVPSLRPCRRLLSVITMYECNVNSIVEQFLDLKALESISTSLVFTCLLSKLIFLLLMSANLRAFYLCTVFSSFWLCCLILGKIPRFSNTFIIFQLLSEHVKSFYVVHIYSLDVRIMMKNFHPLRSLDLHY